MEKANLGLATTRELLDELRARIEVDGKLDYRTVENEQNTNTSDIWPEDSMPAIAFEDIEVEVETEPAEPIEDEAPADKRVVRSQSSGDRVYMLDEIKKTRQWVTNPQVLAGLGFTPQDVKDIEDIELLKYQMAAAIYKVD